MNQTLTANGAIASSQFTNNPVIDFFLAAPGMNMEHRVEDFNKLFLDAFRHDAHKTVKTLLWLRDVRGGSGRRESFRQGIRCLFQYDKSGEFQSTFINIVNSGIIPEVGRWDDLLVVLEEALNRRDVYTRLIAAIHSVIKTNVPKNALCAKWMPRKGKIASHLAKSLFNGSSTPHKDWRKFVSHNTNVVETKMCANEWKSIEYDKLTSMNMSRYMAAFQRHDEDGWINFKTIAKTDPSLIKTEALYPHDVIKSMDEGDKEFADSVWKKMVEDIDIVNKNILSVVDVSASMDCFVSGSTTAMRIAIGLGILTAEKNKGAFKDKVMIFSEKSDIIDISSEKTLYDKVHKIEMSAWSMNTNLQSIFDSLLSFAKAFNVKKKKMPAYILIVSDMEFDSAMCTYYPGGDKNNIDLIREKYKESGYEAPHLIFWNVNSRSMFPHKEDNGITYLSGYSEKILQATLQASFDGLSAEQMIDEMVFSNPRYDYQ